MPAPVQSVQEPQSARSVLMVRPASFGFNPETAASNAFQHAEPSATGTPLGLVLREFEAVAQALERAGVVVLIAPDTLEPA